jgi:hypothetical protein
MTILAVCIIGQTYVYGRAHTAIRLWPNRSCQRPVLCRSQLPRDCARASSPRYSTNKATNNGHKAICYPDLVACVTMSDNGADSTLSTAASSEQAASTAARFDSKCNMYFDKKAYDSWSDAHRATRIWNRDEKTTLWYRTSIIHEQDGSFSLQCATCSKAFAMKNSANFWQTHKKTCPIADPGSESTREQVNTSLTTSSVRRLTESKQRGVETFTLCTTHTDKFISYIVKSIVTGNVASTFLENPHLMEAMSASACQQSHASS